jgi:hypothetical protein
MAAVWGVSGGEDSRGHHWEDSDRAQRTERNRGQDNQVPDAVVNFAVRKEKNPYGLLFSFW